jgi:hypothetical protein
MWHKGCAAVTRQDAVRNLASTAAAVQRSACAGQTVLTAVYAEQASLPKLLTIPQWLQLHVDGMCQGARGNVTAVVLQAAAAAATRTLRTQLNILPVKSGAVAFTANVPCTLTTVHIWQDSICSQAQAIAP